MSTRDRILEAANEAYVEKGHEKFSVRDIAARVGLTPMAIYKHFEDRNHLLHPVQLKGERVKNWGLILALGILALSCGGPSGSEDGSSATDDEGSAGAGGGSPTGGATVGGGATGSGGIGASGGTAGSGGTSQGDGYYIEAVLDGTPYRLTEEVYARPHISGAGFEIYGGSDDVGFGFILFFEPNSVGTFECDGGKNLYMAAHLDITNWTDLFDPEGSCTLELTEVGNEIRGTFSGQLYQIQPEPPLIVTEGRFFVPFN